MKGENIQHFFYWTSISQSAWYECLYQYFMHKFFIYWAASETIRYMQFDLLCNVTVQLLETNIESFRSVLQSK